MTGPCGCIYKGSREHEKRKRGQKRRDERERKTFGFLKPEPSPNFAQASKFRPESEQA